MRIFFLFFAALLAACGGGGGGDSSPVLVAVYGDSLSTGFVDGGRLTPTPVQRLTEYSGGTFQAVDYSQAGLTAPELPPIQGPEQIVVLRMGYADAILGVSAEAHRAAMQKAVDGVIKAGKSPVIAGILTPPEQYDDSARRLDQVQREIAVQSGIPFIDVRSLGRVTLGDAIHPDRAGSDKVTLFIAQNLTTTVKRRTT